MQVRELTVPDCYVFSPAAFDDHRGRFIAPYQADVFAEALGFELAISQVSHSVSRRGVIRGMHFAQVPPGQAKYVFCVKGAVLDVLVDVRVGSPTFGMYDSVEVSAESLMAVYLPEGIAHGFMALEDSVVSYLCSTPYNPSVEHGFSALDPELELPWPGDVESIMSEKDASAPSLAEAKSLGVLPDYAQCQDWYRRLRSTTP